MDNNQAVSPFVRLYSDLEDWLKPLYVDLQSALQAGHLGQTLCFNYSSKEDADALLYLFISRLFCQNPHPISESNSIFVACQKCHSCRLLQAQTHPDFNLVTCLKDKKLIAIEQIRALQNSVYEQAQQGGLRLIWIQDAELLSESAANALLKMVEEPPENCYFIFSINQTFSLIPTLKSRAICFKVSSPLFDVGLQWIENQWKKLPKFNLEASRSHQFETALLLKQNEPKEALNLLRSNLWQQRAVFYQKMEKGLVEKNLWSLRNLFSDSVQTLFFITCMQTLFSDAVKAKNKAGAFIVNRDFAALVRQLLKYDRQQLDNIFKIWQQVEVELNSILSLNQELLIADLLARTELILFEV